MLSSLCTPAVADVLPLLTVPYITSKRVCPWSNLVEAGTAAPREVLGPPLNVKDAVGSSATYRCEDAKAAIDQIEVIPVREDGVVVRSPRQALISEGRICSQELGITIGRKINARGSLPYKL